MASCFHPATPHLSPAQQNTSKTTMAAENGVTMLELREAITAKLSATYVELVDVSGMHSSSFTGNGWLTT